MTGILGRGGPADIWIKAANRPRAARQGNGALGVPLRLCGPNRSRPAEWYPFGLAQPETQRQAALESARNGHVELVVDGSEASGSPGQR